MVKEIIFQNDYKTGLEEWLSEVDVITYLKLINIETQVPNLNFLRQIIVNTFKYIPYQNLTMLTRSRKPPSRQEIIKDMVEGLGGLCTTINPFICALLHSLGFKVGLISTSMHEPDCHMGIIVEIDNMNYWVDLGNGYPYLEPLLLKHGQKYKVLNFNYEIKYHNDLWHIYQTVLGTSKMESDQYFSLILRTYSSFEEMRLLHHTNIEYGHFLKTIRINRWEKGKAFVLRDNLILDIPFKRAKVNKDEGKSWIKKNFFKNNELVDLFDSSWEKIYG